MDIIPKRFVAVNLAQYIHCAKICRSKLCIIIPQKGYSCQYTSLLFIYRLPLILDILFQI